MQASAEEGVPPELVAEPPLSAEEQPQPEPEPAASRSGWMRCETGGARSGRWSLLWLALSPGEPLIEELPYNTCETFFPAGIRRSAAMDPQPWISDEIKSSLTNSQTRKAGFADTGTQR